MSEPDSLRGGLRPIHSEDISEIAIEPHFIDNPDLAIEEKLERIDNVLNWTYKKLQAMDLPARDLVETKVHFFGKTGSELDPQLSIDELLGDDIIENADAIKKALDHRANATLGYRQLDRSYDNNPDDTEDERYAKESVRSAAIRATKILGGFLPKSPKLSLDALGRWLDMQDAEYDTPPGKVDALIVAGAAGLSIHSRLWLGLQSLESGEVETDTIIMAACYRKLSKPEQKKVLDAGLTFGYSAEDVASNSRLYANLDAEADHRYYHEPHEGHYSEADLSIGAAKDLLGANFETQGWVTGPKEHDNSEGVHENRNHYYKAVVEFNGKPLTVYVVKSDHKYGWNAAKKRKDRPTTLETFRSVAPFLSKNAKKVAIGTHGTWGPYQQVIGEEAFGLNMGIETAIIAPHNSTRLFEARDDKGNLILKPDGEPVIDILRAEEVIDEFAKTYQDTANLYKHALAMKEELLTHAA